MTLYFAYGSNMGLAQMRLRCPHSSCLGKACLASHRWLIASDGYANVLPDTDRCVEGVLFKLGDGDEELLDEFEDVHNGGYTRTTLPVSYRGQYLNALVYLNTSPGEGQPSPAYLAQLQAAIADASLSEAYVTGSLLPYLPGLPE